MEDNKIATEELPQSANMPDNAAEHFDQPQLSPEQSAPQTLNVTGQIGTDEQSETNPFISELFPFLSVSDYPQGTPVTNLEIDKRDLTFGEKLVGIGFNPSQNPKVQRAKELCAELADLVKNHINFDEPLTDDVKLRNKLFDHTIGNILNAQMNAVKVLTF